MTNGSKLMNAGVHIKYGLEGLVSPFRFDDEPYSHNCPMFNAKQCAIVLLRCSLTILAIIVILVKINWDFIYFRRLL